MTIDESSFTLLLHCLLPKTGFISRFVVYLSSFFTLGVCVIQFSRYFLTPISFLLEKNLGLVENKGFEPLTPCVQGRCSPS